MNVLVLIEREHRWWESKACAMKHPREQLALACCIGATTALDDLRNAIAMEARQGLAALLKTGTGLSPFRS